MGLNDILKKSNELGKKSKKTFLQVNKYDAPRNAMELIGHICTAARDIDYEPEFDDMIRLYLELREENEDKVLGLSDAFFEHIEEIANSIEHKFLDNTNQLKIAVSGGYSAGKSTFMNQLIFDGYGKKDFLPTDMNPTSLVNTYVNFKGNLKQAVVRGENIKNNLVMLDEDVLASIRHDTQNAKAIANVLRRLIIDMPCKDYLDDITFIDTPGYDNSISVNRENGTTDKDTASKAFKDADVIFWCVTIGNQITEADLNFIMDNGGDEKPVVILLSRMKQKPISEVPTIAKSCLDTASQKLKNVVDVIAFDRDAPLEEIFSCKRNSISSLFTSIKNEYGDSVLDFCSFSLAESFNEEMKMSKQVQDEKQKEYDETVDKLKEARKNKAEFKNDNRDWSNDLRSILIDSYNEVMATADNMIDSSHYAIDVLNDFLSSMCRWDETDHECFTNTLTPILNRFSSKIDACCNKHNASYQYQYYKQEWRQAVLEHYTGLIETLSDTDVFDENQLEQDKQLLSTHLQCERQCQRIINKYKPLFLAALQEVDRRCTLKRNNHYQALQKLDNTAEKDVFAAISGGDMPRFIRCLHYGVELSECNEQGYNVLTWIVNNGNQAMLNVIMEHKDDNEGIDLTIADKNGVNILDAACAADGNNRKPMSYVILVLFFAFLYHFSCFLSSTIV